MGDSLPLLALDMSTPATVVALQLNEDRIFARRESGGGRSEALFPTIAFLLGESGIAPRDLAAIGVGRGPGSFTGVRNAVMAAKTLAWALGIPLFAPSTLDILAWGEAEEGLIAALIDARRGQVYVSMYMRKENSVTSLTPPLALSPESARSLITEHATKLGDQITLTGTGAHAYREIFSDLGRLSEDPLPRAVGLLRACYAAISDGSHDPLLLTPLYLREPDAVPPQTQTAPDGVRGER